jgi:uncharacterized protein HemX
MTNQEGVNDPEPADSPKAATEVPKAKAPAAANVAPKIAEIAASSPADPGSSPPNTTSVLLCGFFIGALVSGISVWATYAGQSDAMKFTEEKQTEQAKTAALLSEERLREIEVYLESRGVTLPKNFR